MPRRSASKNRSKKVLAKRSFKRRSKRRTRSGRYKYRQFGPIQPDDRYGVVDEKLQLALLKFCKAQGLRLYKIKAFTNADERRGCIENPWEWWQYPSDLERKRYWDEKCRNTKYCAPGTMWECKYETMREYWVVTSGNRKYFVYHPIGDIETFKSFKERETFERCEWTDEYILFHVDGESERDASRRIMNQIHEQRRTNKKGADFLALELGMNDIINMAKRWFFGQRDRIFNSSEDFYSMKFWRQNTLLKTFLSEPEKTVASGSYTSASLGNFLSKQTKSTRSPDAECRISNDEKGLVCPVYNYNGGFAGAYVKITGKDAATIQKDLEKAAESAKFRIDGVITRLSLSSEDPFLYEPPYPENIHFIEKVYIFRQKEEEARAALAEAEAEAARQRPPGAETESARQVAEAESARQRPPGAEAESARQRPPGAEAEAARQSLPGMAGFFATRHANRHREGLSGQS